MAGVAVLLLRFAYHKQVIQCGQGNRLTNHKKVIIFNRSGTAQATEWSFFDFGYSSGGTPIQDWYDTLSDHAKQLLDGILKNNKKIVNHLEWSGFRKYLKGGEMKGQGIWELGFFADDLQYRLLGTFDGEKRAVFLMGCYHKGGNYTPPDALGTALKRKRILQQGLAKLYERKIDIDR